MRASLDDDGLKAVEEQTKKLKALQEAADPPEALAEDPDAGLDDLPRTNKPIPIERETLEGVPLYTHRAADQRRASISISASTCMGAAEAAAAATCRCSRAR